MLRKKQIEELLSKHIEINNKQNEEMKTIARNHNIGMAEKRELMDKLGIEEEKSYHAMNIIREILEH